MSNSAARGKQMIEASDYAGAIKEFTSALKESPTSPVYLTSRALAYQRTQQYPEALADADNAVVQAHKRAKKELIVDAQMRRGIILNLMGRYGDARLVFDVVKRLNKDLKELGIWAGRNDKKIAELGEEHEKVQVTVEEVPDLQATTSGTHDQASANTTTNGSATSSAPAQVQQTPIEKIRHDWYQNNQNVYLTLLAKGVPQDKTQVDITERSMSVSFPVAASDSTYDFTLDPLFASVNPSNCITRVLPTKVEIILSKATPGQKWHALESSEPVPSTSTISTDQPSTTASSEPGARAVFTASAPSGPAYPTSSKSGPKNWDKVGDDDDEDDDGDSTNAFFKKLYKGASPEAQRAMMKSFTESNGTALSTNWDEVSKAKVETQPPDGMEAKAWEK